MAPLCVLIHFGVFFIPWFQPRSSHHQHGQGEDRLAVRQRATLGRLVLVGQPPSSVLLFSPHKVTYIIVMRCSNKGLIYQIIATRLSRSSNSDSWESQKEFEASEAARDGYGSTGFPFLPALFLFISIYKSITTAHIYQVYLFNDR